MPPTTLTTECSIHAIVATICLSFATNVAGWTKMMISVRNLLLVYFVFKPQKEKSTLNIVDFMKIYLKPSILEQIYIDVNR